MSRMQMEPASVSSWGGKAHTIGGNVHGEHTHVDTAWDDAAGAGLGGYATYSALSSYTTLFTGVVQKVGQQVQGNGVNLTSTASVVGTHDSASATDVAAAHSRVDGVHTRTVVAI